MFSGYLQVKETAGEHLNQHRPQTHSVSLAQNKQALASFSLNQSKTPLICYFSCIFFLLSDDYYSPSSLSPFLSVCLFYTLQLKQSKKVFAKKSLKAANTRLLAPNFKLQHQVRLKRDSSSNE